MILEFMLLVMKDIYNKIFIENWNLKYLFVEFMRG